MPGDALKGLQGADAAWAKLRSEEFCVPPPTPAVEERSGERLLTPGERPEYDVVVVGGTLGIFVAAALAVKGLKVAVVEQGVLAGRTQEWNISRKELAALVEAGVLSEAELEEIIVSDFSPQRGESKILARPEVPPLSLPVLRSRERWRSRAGGLPVGFSVGEDDYVLDTIQGVSPRLHQLPHVCCWRRRNPTLQRAPP